MMAVKGSSERLAWATIRFSVSRQARWLGRSEEVGGGAALGDRQCAQAGEHGRRLADRLLQAAQLPLAQWVVVHHEHRADHLAAHQRGHAGGVGGRVRAEFASEQRVGIRPLLVQVGEAHGEAGLGLGVKQATRQHRVGLKGGGGLEAVVGVVAVHDDRLPVRDPPLDVQLEQPVGFLLAAHHLHRLRELALAAAVLGLGLHFPSP